MSTKKTNIGTIKSTVWQDQSIGLQCIAVRWGGFRERVAKRVNRGDPNRRTIIIFPSDRPLTLVTKSGTLFNLSERHRTSQPILASVLLVHENVEQPRTHVSEDQVYSHLPKLTLNQTKVHPREYSRAHAKPARSTPTPHCTDGVSPQTKIGRKAYGREKTPTALLYCRMSS